MITAWRWVTDTWKRLFSERRDDPLPMEAIAGALALSAACLLGGSLLAGEDFWINVLASLALLGPGLVVTNVLARNWRTKRRTTALLERVSEPIADLSREIWFDLSDGNKKLAELVPSYKLDIPEFSDEVVGLQCYSIAIDGLLKALEGLTPLMENKPACQILLTSKWSFFYDTTISTCLRSIARLKDAIPTHMAEHYCRSLERSVNRNATEFADAWQKIGEDRGPGYGAIEVEYVFSQLGSLMIVRELLDSLVSQLSEEIS